MTLEHCGEQEHQTIPGSDNAEEELRRLSVEALVEIIIRQRDLIGDLRERVEELARKIEQPNKPRKTSRNSSLPPSKESKPNQKAASKPRKKRGPRVGHRGHSRTRSKPDVVVRCSPSTCSLCGTDLQDLEPLLVGVNQVIDIPPVRPVVVEAHRYSVDCPTCHHQETAPYPTGMEPERVFGSGIESLVNYLHQEHHIGYARLQSLLNEVFHLSVGEGTLVNMIRRGASHLEPEAQEIREQVRNSAVIGSDETGARVDGRNWWQWVFQTEQASYHLIVPSRSSQAIERVIDDAQPEVWVSDLWSAQLKHPAQQHQVCIPHQLRDLQYAIDVDRCVFAYHMQQLFLRAQRLSKHCGSLSTTHYQQQTADIEATCDSLLEQQVASKEGPRLQRRYRKHRASLFVFLYRHDVPSDNNGSERDLRNSVIHRKVSGGFRSGWGAAAYATTISVIQTAKKQGKPILDTLQDSIGLPLPIVFSEPKMLLEHYFT
jgi:transposase